MIGNAQYISDVDASFWSMVRAASIAIVVLMLASIAVAWAITRSVVKPLSGLKERMASLSAGELDAPVANAERSDEIGHMARTQSATKDSVTAIKEIGATIARISEISATIASAVEEQGAATQEISRNVQRAAEGTSQVETSIADVQRGASEAGGASSQVLSAAQSLSTESNRLKHEVAKFMNSVRAA